MRGGGQYDPPMRRDWNKWSRAPQRAQEADINLTMDGVASGNMRKRPRQDEPDDRIHLNINDDAPTFNNYHRQNVYRPLQQVRPSMHAGQGQPPTNGRAGNIVHLPFHPRPQGRMVPEPAIHPDVIYNNGARPEAPLRGFPPSRGFPPGGQRGPWQGPPRTPPPQHPAPHLQRQIIRGDPPPFPRNTPSPSRAPPPRPVPPGGASAHSELGGFLAMLRQDQEVLERDHGVDGATYNFYRPRSMMEEAEEGGQEAEGGADMGGGTSEGGGLEQQGGGPGGASNSTVAFAGPMSFPQGLFSADASCTRLHHEILAFCRQLLPTREERRRKDVACETFMSVILRLWPTCHVSLFGSYATNLYLPGSDIDVAVLFSGPPATVAEGGLKASNMRAGALSKPALRRKLETLAQELRSNGLIREMRKIPFAKVPIIKCVNQQGVVCDIAFDACNGPLAVPLVRSLLAKYPALHPLCLVLKVWLLQRGFNEVFTGGIGSYCLINMIVSHLQLHGGETDLGKLLLSFFHFFGTAFDYESSTIAISRGGVVPKSHKGWGDAKKYLLSVEDPQDAVQGGADADTPPRGDAQQWRGAGSEAQEAETRC
eukprot:jgi/Mesvir1/7121/Mv09223-RA.1